MNKTPPTPCHQHPTPGKLPLSSVRWKSNHEEPVTPSYPMCNKYRVAYDWKMLVDVGWQLVFPPQIATTTLKPDLDLLELYPGNTQ